MKNNDSEKPETRSLMLMSTMVAIAWFFIGLRPRKDFEQDIGRLNLFYVLIAAFLGVTVFIGILLTAVRYAVSKSVQRPGLARFGCP